MKKNLFLLLLTLVLGSTASQAQSPAIKELRALVEEAPMKFETQLGEVDKENDGLVYYKTKNKSGDVSFIVLNKTGRYQYYMIYNLDPNDMSFKLKTMLMGQYITELNAMVKTGKYKGSDLVQDGNNVTRITDLEGNRVVDLQSTSSNFFVIVYGN